MRIDLGLQRFQLVTLILNFCFINLVNVEIEITEHVIKGNGDIIQLVFMLFVDGNIGIKLAILYMKHGIVYTVELP